MKTRQSGIALFADALATTFSLFPQGDYRTAYPHKSPAKRMDEAWSRTGVNMCKAVNGVTRKHGITR